jgi:hypothetical protein
VIVPHVHRIKVPQARGLHKVKRKAKARPIPRRNPKSQFRCSSRFDFSMLKAPTMDGMIRQRETETIVPKLVSNSSKQI